MKNWLSAGAVVVLFNSSFLWAQCSSDPKVALNQVVTHMKAQRTRLNSAAASVTYDSVVGKNRSSAQYKRTLLPTGMMTYQQTSPDTNIARPIRMTVDRDSKLSVQDRRQMEFTDENYSYEYLGLANGNFKFKLIPNDGREGLVNGEFWIDAVTCNPTHVAGQVIVHNFFAREMIVDEDFQTVNGIYLPKRLQLNFRIFAIFKFYTGSLTALSSYDLREVILNPTPSAGAAPGPSVNSY